eukprot:4908514-Pyramimonas_sp.AAC.1
MVEHLSDAIEIIEGTLPAKKKAGTQLGTALNMWNPGQLIFREAKELLEKAKATVSAIEPVNEKIAVLSASVTKCLPD